MKIVISTSKAGVCIDLSGFISKNIKQDTIQSYWVLWGKHTAAPSAIQTHVSGRWCRLVHVNTAVQPIHQE